MRRWVYWAMFLSSYMPLFVLLGLRAIHHSRFLVATCCVLVLLGAGGTLLLLRTAPEKSLTRYRLLEVENRDSDVAAYAATYLLPFLFVFGGPWPDILSLGAFIAFLGVVYVRSRLIYVNPTLALFGYRLWRVIPATAGSSTDERAGIWPRFLLARTHQIASGQLIQARYITHDLLLFDSEVGE